MANQLTVGLSVCLWVVLRTSTVLPSFLSLSLYFASQTLSFFSYSAFISPLPPRQLAEPSLASGLSRLPPPAQRIYSLPLLLGILKYPEIIHIHNTGCVRVCQCVCVSDVCVCIFLCAMERCYLSGVRLLPCSFISSMISDESRGELALASRRSCSCWARY